jgi:hypothetical protein
MKISSINIIKSRVMGSVMDCGIEFFERAASLQMRPSRALPGSYIGFGERYRAGAVRRIGTHIGPANFARAIHNVSYRRGNESSPMAFILRANGTNEFRIGVHQ